MSTENLRVTVENLIHEMALSYHSTKPGVITEINGNLLKVSFVTYSRYKNGMLVGVPDIWVPAYQLRTKQAVISIPYSIGDNVVVLFSDRDFVDMLSKDEIKQGERYFPIDNNAFPLVPLLAIPSHFCSSEKQEMYDHLHLAMSDTTLSVKQDGIEGTYKDSSISLTEASVTLSQNDCSVEVGQDTIVAKVGSGASVELSADSFVINVGGQTFTFNSAGMQTLADILSGTMTMQTHFHTGVEAGTDVSGPPVL